MFFSQLRKEKLHKKIENDKKLVEERKSQELKETDISNALLNASDLYREYSVENANIINTMSVEQSVLYKEFYVSVILFLQLYKKKEPTKANIKNFVQVIASDEEHSDQLMRNVIDFRLINQNFKDPFLSTVLETLMKDETLRFELASTMVKSLED